MKKTQKERSYVAPEAECIELHIEQCIAASGEATGDLGEMGNNDLVNDFIFDPNFIGLL